VQILAVKIDLHALVPEMMSSKCFARLFVVQVVEALNNIACVHCKNAALSEWTRIVDGEHETDKLAVKVKVRLPSCLGVFSRFRRHSCMARQLL
jgi:hypothetical protein